MGKRTRYQEKAIKSYYDNREAIAVQRLQELVTELYLAEGKRRQQHWKNVEKHLQALNVKQELIDHYKEKDDPELIANYIKTLMKQA